MHAPPTHNRTSTSSTLRTTSSKRRGTWSRLSSSRWGSSLAGGRAALALPPVLMPFATGKCATLGILVSWISICLRSFTTHHPPPSAAAAAAACTHPESLTPSLYHPRLCCASPSGQPPYLSALSNRPRPPSSHNTISAASQESRACGSRVHWHRHLPDHLNSSTPLRCKRPITIMFDLKSPVDYTSLSSYKGCMRSDSHAVP